MKRSEMLKLIANQLDFLNGTFEGVRDNFTEVELARANVILTTIEEADMQPPAYTCINESDPKPTLVGSCKIRKWEEE